MLKYVLTYEVVSIDAEGNVHIKKFQSDITRISEILQTVTFKHIQKIAYNVMSV